MCSPLVSIVIPTYNERDNIVLLIPRLHRVLEQSSLSYEIIIVDDNSPDGTAEIALELSRTFPVRVIKRQRKLGLASAVIEGFRHARGKVLIVMDADLQHPPETVPELVRKILDEGQAGDNAGLLLRGVEKDEIDRGMVLAKPGSIKPHTKFKAEIYVLKKEEGGRHTPFFKGYRPQFYFRTTDVTGAIILPEGTEMVMPGDNVNLNVELITPIAMEQELRFAIREGGHTVGAGVVTEIVE